VGPLWGARSIQVTTPIGPRASPKGALRVSMSLSSASAPGGAIGYLLLYVGFSSVAIALFGLSLLRRQLFQPIDALQQGTARIAKGEFGIRLEIDAARELQELCAALNSMSQSLEDYRHKTGEQVERLRETNRALRETQEALVQSERLAGVGRLAAGLAHEVGNPLAAVLGFVDMLAEGSQTPEVDQGLIVRSQQELARIHGIIRQLLDYSHPQVESASNVGLTQLFAEAAASVRHLPELHGVDLELADVTGIEVLGLEKELHQVVVNLIRNAADAVSGVERATIRLCAAMVGDGVDVVCEDNGPGFATEAKNQALEPFYTTKDVGKGTGLGLAFCFRTMERLGGAIFLEDSALGGALVRLRFRGPN